MQHEGQGGPFGHGDRIVHAEQAIVRREDWPEMVLVPVCVQLAIVRDHL